MAFGNIRKFDGKNYKLATLHKGVTKGDASRTAKMNKKEGNKTRIVKDGRKYATYVRKSRR